MDSIVQSFLLRISDAEGDLQRTRHELEANQRENSDLEERLLLGAEAQRAVVPAVLDARLKHDSLKHELARLHHCLGPPGDWLTPEASDKQAEEVERLALEVLTLQKRCKHIKEQAASEAAKMEAYNTAQQEHALGVAREKEAQQAALKQAEDDIRSCLAQAKDVEATAKAVQGRLDKLLVEEREGAARVEAAEAACAALREALQAHEKEQRAACPQVESKRRQLQNLGVQQRSSKDRLALAKSIKDRFAGQAKALDQRVLHLREQVKQAYC